MKDFLDNQKVNRRSRSGRKSSVKSVFSPIDKFRLQFHGILTKITLPRVMIACFGFCVFAGLFMFLSITLDEKSVPDSASTALDTRNSNIKTTDIASGLGLLGTSQDEDTEYQIKKGDSLWEISQVYGIDPVYLALYNKLDNPDALKLGQKLVVPSQEHLHAFTQSLGSWIIDEFQAKIYQKTTESGLPPVLQISHVEQRDQDTTTAHFSIQTKLDNPNLSYIWDLGNGLKSYRAEPAWTYKTPGTYVVMLTLKDQNGNKRESNKVYVNVPYPTSVSSSNIEMLSLNGVGELFSIAGDILSIQDFTRQANDPIQLVSTADGKNVYQAKESGYFYITAKTSDGGKKYIYLFVSPYDSVQVERSDLNWYRTQYNTGTASNCGPSTVAMSIAWAKGIDVPVSSIRDLVGWTGDGGTSFIDLKRGLDQYAVNHVEVASYKKEDIMGVIDRGHIAIVLIHTSLISWSSGDSVSNLVGKYYSDSIGHYIVIKGYTKDKKYFIVQDPIPSDWYGNNVRYGDGISMIGRNRFYLTDEVMVALRQNVVIEISR